MMESKVSTYVEALIEMGETRDLSPELKDLIKSVRDPQVARHLLVLDEEHKILEPNSDFVLSATLGIRGLINSGLMRRNAEGVIEFSDLLIVGCLFVSAMKTVSSAASSHKIAVTELINAFSHVEFQRHIDSIRHFIMPG
jgi:hypothetical protein